MHDTKFNHHFIYYSHFEITEFSQYQYLFDLVAGFLKSGDKKAFTSCFVPETEMVQKRVKMVRFETEMAQFRARMTRFKTDVI